MQVKYAFLHCSYAAPVLVSDIVVVVVAAARAVDGAAAVRTDTFAVVELRDAVVAARDVVGVAAVRVVTFLAPDLFGAAARDAVVRPGSAVVRAVCALSVVVVR